MFIVLIEEEKQGVPIEVISQFFALKFNVVKLLQSLNASSPIKVTFSGIETEVKLLQNMNAHPPIEVTLLGIETEVKLLHSKNAASPIEVTL